MALNVPFVLGRYLNWETSLPFKSSRHESPVFTYMDMKWKLLFDVQYFRDCYCNYIVLINCDKTKGFEPFSISTYLERKGYSEIKCSTVTVNYGFEFLYVEKESVVYEKMQITSNNRNVTIKCVFPASTDLFLDVKLEKEDKATDNPDKDFNSEDNGNLPLTVTDNSLPDQTPAEKVSHFQSMSEDLEFMFDKDLMTDVTIKCGEVVVSAHKNILAARSKVFADMLQNEKCECKSTLDNLEIKTPVLRTFIRYFYAGKIEDLSQDNVLDLYSTSYKYEVNALRSECSHFLACNVNPENYLNILTLAGKYNDEYLKDAVGKFVCDHDSLLATDSWRDFSKHSPVLANGIYQKFAEKMLSNNVQP